MFRSKIALILLIFLIGCGPTETEKCIERVERNKEEAKKQGLPDPYDGVIAQAVCFS